MRTIHFSDVGVVVNSMEEIDEIHLLYNALNIAFPENFKAHCIEAQQSNVTGYFIQSTRGDLKTKLEDDALYVSVIKYPISYSMDKFEYAVAYHLLKSNQEDELKAHLDKHCKEYN